MQDCVSLCLAAHLRLVYERFKGVPTLKTILEAQYTVKTAGLFMESVMTILSSKATSTASPEDVPLIPSTKELGPHS